jgi:hypothetical protein
MSNLQTTKLSIYYNWGLGLEVRMKYIISKNLESNWDISSLIYEKELKKFKTEEDYLLFRNSVSGTSSYHIIDIEKTKDGEVKSLGSRLRSYQSWENQISEMVVFAIKNFSINPNILIVNNLTLDKMKVSMKGKMDDSRLEFGDFSFRFCLDTLVGDDEYYLRLEQREDEFSAHPHNLKDTKTSHAEIIDHELIVQINRTLLTIRDKNKSDVLKDNEFCNELKDFIKSLDHFEKKYFINCIKKNMSTKDLKEDCLADYLISLLS